MKIATWNVNSLNVRLPQVIDWLKLNQPDVLALQEIKMVEEKFPYEVFSDLGYHAATSGQPAYNGVSILSRKPLGSVQIGLPSYADEQKRLIAGLVDGIYVVNVYIPNGSDLQSEKYVYKLAWLEQLYQFLQSGLMHFDQVIVLGDFNIAPQDQDVYDPEKFAGNVLVSEPERAFYQKIIELGFFDSFRLFEPELKSYSWWDYRAGAFHRNHGLRIDHILATDSLKSRCLECMIDRGVRKNIRPSDHVPVMLTIE